MKKFILNIWYTILFQFDQHKEDIPYWWYEQKPFDHQPTWMQRVRVAEDALQQIIAGRYIAREGSYVKYVKADVKYDDDIKANFEKISSCRVCALGACLMSITKFKNHLKFDDLYSGREFIFSSKINALFESLFDYRQIYLIEEAFEGPDTTLRYAKEKSQIRISKEERQSCLVFYCRYQDSEKRLIAIFKNIIANKGTFIP